MMKKTVVYTAIFGDYDELIPQQSQPNVDFICFTNSNIESKNWEIRTVDPPFSNDFVRSNRYFKINPHLVLPEYEQSIYIDGNILIIHPLKQLIHRVFEQNQLAAFAHTPPISNSENCIYREYDRIAAIARTQGKWIDDPNKMKEQMEYLRQEFYPKENGLIVGSVLMRKHNERQVIEAMEIWWEIVKNKSRRDQLSFNYAIWKTALDILYLPGEARYYNPWFWRLGGHNQALWFRYLKYKIRLGLGKIQHPEEHEFLTQIEQAIVTI